MSNYCICKKFVHYAGVYHITLNLPICKNCGRPRKYDFPSFMSFDGSQFSIIATDEEGAIYYSDELKIKLYIKPIPYDAGKDR